MKKILTFFLSFIMIFTLVSCSFTASNDINNQNNVIEQTEETEALNSVEYSKNGNFEVLDEEYYEKLSHFSNRIYEMASKEVDDNYAISPLSIYMALAILHYIGDENVKSDVEELFGMTEEDILKTGKLFLNLVRQKEFEDKVISQLDLTNSIWFDTYVNGNKNVLDRLAEEFFCHAFKTTFSQNIDQANQDIREFIKEQTKGLIDKDFDLSADTLFAIINTLYFKDIWNDNGTKLETKTDRFYIGENFKEVEFLIGNYYAGEVAETKNSYYFYTMTESGYKVKLVVPKDGYTLKEVMTEENLNEVNVKTDYNKVNEKNEIKEQYYTRCIFPKFKIDSDTDLKEILEQNEYLLNAFSGYSSELVDASLVVSEIIHKTVIDVDDEGVEGAAVTIIVTKETSVAPGEPKF